ncbi:MAG: sulfotransferase [Deltaproteobacteria bacterium]|nr:sulfotransferase [Candidatus Zymogenaceae bacterium]
MTKKAVIVLGMHRSGTSAITAGLEAMGISLGNYELEANPENPKGYFENGAVRGLNDNLLKFLHSRWDNPFFDGRRAIDEAGDGLSDFYRRADEIFKKNFEGKPIWAVKDPRMCLTLPFWVKVFERHGFDGTNTYYLHMVRHPVEVAESQRERHKKVPAFHFIGSDPRQTMALWLSHHYQALREVNSNKNIVVLFHKLIENPTQQMFQVERFLGIEHGREAVDEYCRGFLERGLKHHNEKDDAPMIWSRCVRVLYRWFCEMEEEYPFGKGHIDDILNCLSDYEDALELFHPSAALLSDAWYRWQGRGW